jgi:transcriptional regulator with XRE-family HTH domain
MQMTALRELREQKGYKSSYIAKKLGVSLRHFQRIEKEGHFLDQGRKKILAELYDVKISQITSAIKATK